MLCWKPSYWTNISCQANRLIQFYLYSTLTVDMVTNQLYGNTYILNINANFILNEQARSDDGIETPPKIDEELTMRGFRLKKELRWQGYSKYSEYINQRTTVQWCKGAGINIEWVFTVFTWQYIHIYTIQRIQHIYRAYFTAKFSFRLFPF